MRPGFALIHATGSAPASTHVPTFFRSTNSDGVFAAIMSMMRWPFSSFAHSVLVYLNGLRIHLAGSKRIHRIVRGVAAQAVVVEHCAHAGSRATASTMRGETPRSARKSAAARPVGPAPMMSVFDIVDGPILSTISGKPGEQSYGAAARTIAPGRRENRDVPAMVRPSGRSPAERGHAARLP